MKVFVKIVTFLLDAFSNYQIIIAQIINRFDEES